MFNIQGHSEVAHYIPEHRFRLITISIIGVSLVIGILLPSIELIIGLVGSTIGVAICVIFPASCFISAGKKHSGEVLVAKVFSIYILKYVCIVYNTFLFTDTSDIRLCPDGFGYVRQFKCDRRKDFW